jgi:hypothetical protein
LILVQGDVDVDAIKVNSYFECFWTKFFAYGTGLNWENLGGI